MAGSLVAPGGASGKLQILCYHRVLPAPDPMIPDGLDCSLFNMHMEVVARQFTPLPLAKAIDLLQSHSLPPRAISITFDDGYADNLVNALPILRKHGVPATVFVASGFIDGGRMWNDTITEAVRRAPGETFDATEFGLAELPLRSMSERGASALKLVLQLRRLPTKERAEHVERLAERIGAELPNDLMLSSDQVRELDAAGVEIGAHTVSHPILSRLTPEASAEEIRRSRETLRDIIGHDVTGFAYPNGKPGIDYDAEHVAAVRESGYDYAVTTAPGYSTADSDRFQLPRFLPWDKSRLGLGLRVLQGYRHRSVESAGSAA